MEKLILMIYKSLYIHIYISPLRILNSQFGEWYPFSRHTHSYGECIDLFFFDLLGFHRDWDLTRFKQQGIWPLVRSWSHGGSTILSHKGYPGYPYWWLHMRGYTTWLGIIITYKLTPNNYVKLGYLLKKTVWWNEKTGWFFMARSRSYVGSSFQKLRVVQGGM
jgi:hypothetical protein